MLPQSLQRVIRVKRESFKQSSCKILRLRCDAEANKGTFRAVVIIGRARKAEVRKKCHASTSRGRLARRIYQLIVRVAFDGYRLSEPFNRGTTGKEASISIVPSWGDVNTLLITCSCQITTQAGFFKHCKHRFTRTHRVENIARVVNT